MNPPDWQDLLDRALRRGAPTDRFAWFATVDADGHPRCRTVVVRAFVPGPEPSVVFTTDARSAKAGEVAADPRSELCWYLLGERQQLRLSGTATAIADAERRLMRWRSLATATRQTFFGPPPGTPATAGTEADARSAAEAADLELPPASFMAIELHITAVDLVDLSAETLRRWWFARTPTHWTAASVNP